MNRRYTTAEYRKSVELLRKYIPDVALTTDVMVGFPGETDEEFDKTYEFLADIRFSKMHVFKYSPRKGTPAAKFEEQVDGLIKEARSAKVLELSDKCMLEYNSGFTGRLLPVLYEQRVKGPDGLYEGYTPNYIRVVSKGEDNLIGSISMTELVRTEGDHIAGRVIG
jgi:threonylcarbamoyladenosine tRNA methylthiotransferase MtaB